MSEQKTVTISDGQNPAVPQSFLHLTQNMESELEQRKSDWEKEVSKMQQDFFKMKTAPTSDKTETGGKTKVVEMKTDIRSPRRKGTGSEIFDISHAKTLYCDQPDGTKLYKLRFDVKGYEPNEISIKAEGQKLSVTAQTEEENSAGNKAIKNFNRQVDIPKTVDPDKLVSFLSSDGILSVEAPVEWEEEEEEEEMYPEMMAGSLMPPGVEPPQYHNVVDGSSLSVNYGVPEGYGGVSSVGYAPGGGGYSYSSSSSGYPGTYVTPGVSYHIETCSHGHNHGHHRNCTRDHPPPRKPLATHVKRCKSPRPKVDYFAEVRGKGNHGYSSGGIGNHGYSSSSGGNPGYSSSSGGNHGYSSSSRGNHGYSSGSLGISLLNDMHSSPMEHFRYNDPTIVTAEEGRRLKMVVDIGRDYSPEDVHVTLSDRKISVHANREQTISGRKSKRQFSRDFHSPEDLESYTARASLGEEGKLYIGACVKGNKDQDSVMGLVHGDMPSHAKACNLSLD